MDFYDYSDETSKGKDNIEIEEHFDYVIRNDIRTAYKYIKHKIDL